MRSKRLGLFVEVYTGKWRKIKLLCEQQSDSHLMARMSEESVPIALLLEISKISVKDTSKKKSKYDFTYYFVYLHLQI